VVIYCRDTRRRNTIMPREDLSCSQVRAYMYGVPHSDFSKIQELIDFFAISELPPQAHNVKPC